MTVAHVLKNKGNTVHSVSVSDDIRTAVARYVETGARSLVVTDGPRLAGIITVKDVMAGLAKHGGSLLDMPISDHMTSEVISIDLDAELEDVEAVLLEHGFNHIPVVDGENLAGVVTLSDVLGRHLSEANTVSEDLRAYVFNSGYPI